SPFNSYTGGCTAVPRQVLTSGRLSLRMFALHPRCGGSRCSMLNRNVDAEMGRRHVCAGVRPRVHRGVRGKSSFDWRDVKVQSGRLTFPDGTTITARVN